MSRASTTASGSPRCAGLPSQFGIHACRHTYASVLIVETRNVLVVMERLGHASTDETFGSYGHLFPKDHAETTGHPGPGVRPAHAAAAGG